MGRSIVYCDKCGQRLKEEDFLQGKATTADNRSFCANCRPSTPRTPKPGSSSTLLLPDKKVSSTRIPAAPKPGSDSRRLPVQPSSAEAEEKSGSPKVYLGVAGAIALVIGIVVAVTSGRKDKEQGKDLRRDQGTTQTIVSVPPPPDNLSTVERQREEAARAACIKAYGVNEKDVMGRWKAFQEALAASQGTSYAPDASNQLAKIRQRFADERAEIETRAAELIRTERFKASLDLWESEQKRYDISDWIQPVGQRMVELRADFERRLGIMRETAADAKRRGDEAEAKKVRARVAGWGMAGYPEQIDRAIAEAVVAPKGDPSETLDPASKALETYRGQWRQALAPVAARDYAEAIKAMEKLVAEAKDPALKKEAGEDLENLRLASTVVQEAAPLLSKLAKGQRVAITFRNMNGGWQRVEDVVAKIDANRIEMKMGEGGVVFPLGEIGVVTMAELFKARATKKDTDGRAAALACILDGDAEGARRVQGEPAPAIPDKYAVYAQEVAEAAAGEKEKAARDLFWDAELDYFDYGAQAAAIAKYKTLLNDHAGTAFVRRNRAAIAARTEGGTKDFLFAASDLTVAPGFKLGKHGKVEAAWTSQQDLDVSRMKDNYVELEFSATSESEYRCWVYAGGCCLEVLTFYYQGTELTGPDPANPKEKIALEPGSGAGLMAKLPYVPLKKLHSQHNGPKAPEKFEWVQVGAFKYPTAGTKRIRILSNQKGFAVAQAAVLTTKPGPPKDADYKELEKWRAETPGASLKQGGFVTGTILREAWKGIQGGGIGDLTNHPDFKADKPAESGLLTVFEGPVNWSDNYGSRIRGYVYPPATGNYIFWISTDDQGELWLSTDEDPAHKRKIASVPEWTSPREWEKHSAQKSEPIPLKAGRRYYIEALHKEGSGGDHVAVGWQLPSGTQERPIPGPRLSPFVLPKK